MGLMLLFQNCGSSESGISAALTDYDAAQADKLQFAFDASIDHIGYMSCESDAPQGPHFNFKVGAFNDGEGLKFRDNFMSSLGALAENKTKLLEYLFASKRNSNAGVVMSLRESGQFRGPVKFGGGSTEDFVEPMLWSPAANVQLANPTISSLLYENPNGVNYLSGIQGGTDKSFEGDIYFKGVGAQSLVVRPGLQSNTYLALTFAVDDLENGGALARSPYDPTGVDSAASSSVFGKGYQMDFAQLDIGRSSSPKVVMTEVTGFNLENESSLGEGWICPPSERYIIVKDSVDAMRRFDGARPTKDAFDYNGDGSISGPGEIEIDDDLDGSPDANNPWDDDYRDGGTVVTGGGYYMEYMTADIDDVDGDEDETELIKVKHKVICPMVPDEMISGQAEHTDPAWKRVRSLLGSDEWYVYRGSRYNCIVPKKSNGSCYGKFENASGGNTVPLVQYFASEDFIERELTENRRVEAEIEAGNPVERTEFPVVTDCEASSGNASSRFCPHVLSVCHKP
ncbi:MAG: hypothetical protein ACRBBP_01070 [Bdellovibrionales bacterium]